MNNFKFGKHYYTRKKFKNLFLRSHWTSECPACTSRLPRINHQCSEVLWWKRPQCIFTNSQVPNLVFIFYWLLQIYRQFFACLYWNSLAFLAQSVINELKYLVSWKLSRPGGNASTWKANFILRGSVTWIDYQSRKKI